MKQKVMLIKHLNVKQVMRDKILTKSSIFSISFSKTRFIFRRINKYVTQYIIMLTEPCASICMNISLLYNR